MGVMYRRKYVRKFSGRGKVLFRVCACVVVAVLVCLVFIAYAGNDYSVVVKIIKDFEKKVMEEFSIIHYEHQVIVSYLANIDYHVHQLMSMVESSTLAIICTVVLFSVVIIVLIALTTWVKIKTYYDTLEDMIIIMRKKEEERKERK